MMTHVDVWLVSASIHPLTTTRASHVTSPHDIIAVITVTLTGAGVWRVGVRTYTCTWSTSWPANMGSVTVPGLSAIEMSVLIRLGGTQPLPGVVRVSR